VVHLCRVEGHTETGAVRARKAGGEGLVMKRKGSLSLPEGQVAEQEASSSDRMEESSMRMQLSDSNRQG